MTTDHISAPLFLELGRAACSWANIDRGQKAPILSQVGDFYSDEVGQFYIGANIYWNNVVSGIKRDMLRAALVPEGMAVESGSIVDCVQGPTHQAPESRWII